MSDLRQDCAGIGKGQRRAIWIQEGARCWLPWVAESQHSEDKGLVAKTGWNGLGELASKQVRTTRKLNTKYVFKHRTEIRHKRTYETTRSPITFDKIVWFISA